MYLLVVGLVTLAGVYAKDCGQYENCIPIRSCDVIIDQLKIAKNTDDSEKRLDIIKQVRTKICGDLEDNLICCPAEEEDYQDAQQPQEDAPAKYLGEFVNIYHDIGGQVYALSEDQLIIKGFTYDGEGPDAFFLAGESGSKPNSRTTRGDHVLPYPFTGDHFDYLDKSIPILGGFYGTEDIVLTLPPGVSTNNLRWLSVWCRDYKVNFGHATFN